VRSALLKTLAILVDTRSGLAWTPHSMTRRPAFSLVKSQAAARDSLFNLQRR
jgi:hypothetical protein